MWSVLMIIIAMSQIHYLKHNYYQDYCKRKGYRGWRREATLSLKADNTVGPFSDQLPARQRPLPKLPPPGIPLIPVPSSWGQQESLLGPPKPCPACRPLSPGSPKHAAGASLVSPPLPPLPEVPASPTHQAGGKDTAHPASAAASRAREGRGLEGGVV
jgi:hypothetical protein